MDTLQNKKTKRFGRREWAMSLGVLIALTLAGFLLYFFYPRTVTIPDDGADIFGVAPAVYTFDPLNASYNIDGQSVTLINGTSEIESDPGSASKTVTRYFGNEAYGDVDGDDDNDAAFLITQNSGGTGLFYYVVVALRTPTGYQLTNTVFIGDRIAPQTTEIQEETKVLRVNFADRKKDEPMSAEPTMGMTLPLKVNQDGVLEKVK